MAEAAKAQHSELGTLVLATHRLCHLDQVAYLSDKKRSFLLIQAHYHLHPTYPTLPPSDLYLSIAFLLVIKLDGLFLFYKE